ncbi:hypothetical protein COU14_00720 [Candidatus Kaiserbacteria bacterium CG10_big_fil_rev_8_21_14_0_10_44_10]|uniref:Uncharacterized protein n=1 Tax=Candidatus Kaiserbacteria bacterium CG10_big_fil_rev_8_21_14_0_10_44_10 TaxID=1974606 RepID=A0A2H0UIA0_9BACT|nr:MAG: hypothetical protein COU14_00720 [Candidatus Kaiserbacteria bacterium CG10_big_fil_rev_8_21_14_0_10_44_10]
MKPEQLTGSAIDKVDSVVENQGFFLQEGLLSRREDLCRELLEFVDGHASVYNPEAGVYRTVPMYYHHYMLNDVERNVYATVRLLRETDTSQPTEVLIRFLTEVTKEEQRTVLADAALEVTLASGNKIKVLEFATESLPVIPDPRFGVSSLDILQQQQSQVAAVAETLKHLKSPERQTEADKRML